MRPEAMSPRQASVRPEAMVARQRSPRLTVRTAPISQQMVNIQLPDATGAGQAAMKTVNSSASHRQSRRAKTLGAIPDCNVSVAVIAPGGGTGANAAVYSALGRKGDLSVDILGKSRSQYDRYPPAWKHGAPAPNLESFAGNLADQGELDDVDCLVVGSRGGQVVLPALWKMQGDSVPPAVVMNGGCAMDLPISVQWPQNAVTFLLIGGRDYFRGTMKLDGYLADAQARVPEGNETTAILLVNEMLHMPQSGLLLAVLPHMISALSSWKATGDLPADDFCRIVGSLRQGGWHGKLTYKTGKGRSWACEAFP